MSEMKKRIARAIEAAQSNWETAEGQAEWVLEAMRTPTQEMLDEVLRDDRIDRDPRDYWAWMIDAALK